MTTHSLSPVVLFAAIWVAQVAIPGPNFVRVSTVALNGSRKSAVITSAGTATGNALWCLVAALGLAGAEQAPFLFAMMRGAGAAYFAWYGVILLSRAIRPRPILLVSGVRNDAGRLYASGVVTALASPQAVIFFATALTATFGTLDPGTILSAVLVVAGVNLAWYAVVIGVLSSPGPKAAFLKARPLIETFLGVALLYAAVRLAMLIDLSTPG